MSQDEAHTSPQGAMKLRSKKKKKEPYGHVMEDNLVNAFASGNSAAGLLLYANRLA